MHKVYGISIVYDYFCVCIEYLIIYFYMSLSNNIQFLDFLCNSFQSGGDLENDEEMAARILTFVRTVVKVPLAELSPEQGTFKRVSGLCIS